MNSIFNTGQRAEFINRINKLTPASHALWGKMNVSQMLAHCQAPLLVALGDLTITRGLMGVLFGKIAKKKLVSDQPFKPNLPTFKEAKITGEREFDKEKKELISLIHRFEVGPDVLTPHAHGFFGPLTTSEWDTLQVKHLDHHLRQFGV
ncbi:MAG: DUF1569 domain-containing protein [Bacteroidota bacterium]|nr:DUF1569 domain-containing protein [Bacteroidota bacterium]